jgi:hypothetical protein
MNFSRFGKVDGDAVTPLMLWGLLFLFTLRVLGQLLVALGCGWFLPPMERWQSGLIAYPWLFASQVIIIILYSKVCVDFTRRKGFFFAPRRMFGSGLVAVGSIYFTAMLVRYAIRMTLYPQERWAGGTIPIKNWARDCQPLGDGNVLISN